MSDRHVCLPVPILQVHHLLLVGFLTRPSILLDYFAFPIEDWS